MARTAINPVVMSTPGQEPLALVQVLAANSVTWKKGELGYISSGTVTPVDGTGRTVVNCIFAEDQDTSTSTSTVPVYMIADGTRFRMFVQTNGSAAAASAAALYARYGVEQGPAANTTYLDTGTANGQFEVQCVASNKDDLEDGKSDTDAAPGVVECIFRALVS